MFNVPPTSSLYVTKFTQDKTAIEDSAIPGDPPEHHRWLNFNR